MQYENNDTITLYRNSCFCNYILCIYVRLYRFFVKEKKNCKRYISTEIIYYLKDGSNNSIFILKYICIWIVFQS